MPAVAFCDAEAEYLEWLNNNRAAGLVVNTRRQPDPKLMVLHRATCRSICCATSQMGAQPFTGSDFIKVCSTEEDELLRWIEQHGGSGFTGRCSLCGP
jgi:hypothetical protein